MMLQEKKEKQSINWGLIFTVIFGIISIVLAIFLYKLSDKKREPLYSVKKEPSLIFDKENSSPKIKLLSNDTTIIDKNVYVTSFVIWNDGGLPIKKQDLRKDFRIVPLNQAEILDYKIVKQTHPQISKFVIKERTDGMIIDWDFFDPRHGFELQLVYAGSQKSEIIIEGYVLGTSIEEVKAKRANSDKVFWAANVLFMLYTLFLVYTLFTRKNIDRRNRIFFGLILIMCLTGLFLFSYTFSRFYDLPL